MSDRGSDYRDSVMGFYAGKRSDEPVIAIGNQRDMIPNPLNDPDDIPKICPFCGGEPVLVPSNEFGKIVLRCRSCAAEGGWGKSNGTATKMWNMRHDDDPLKKLGDATMVVNEHHPLPRCKHGNALKDHADERLEPDCGCRS